MVSQIRAADFDNKVSSISCIGNKFDDLFLIQCVAEFACLDLGSDLVLLFGQSTIWTAMSSDNG